MLLVKPAKLLDQVRLLRQCRAAFSITGNALVGLLTMAQLPEALKSRPLSAKNTSRQPDGFKRENMYGDWNDYTSGPSQSLKNINDILTAHKQHHIYKYIDEIFEDIAIRRESDPEGCKAEFEKQVWAFLDRFKGQEKLNYLMLLMIYHRSYEEWEGSLRHEPVHILLGAVQRYYESYSIARTANEQYIISLFLNVFMILSCGMRIENALNVNCPLGIIKHSEKVAGILLQGTDLPPFDANEDIIVTWVKREIAEGKTYFDALRELSAAVVTWLHNEPQWQTNITKAADNALKSQDKIKEKSYCYATELDAHRATLKNIIKFGDAAQCSVESFKIVYCFPFVIHGLAPAQLANLGQTAENIFRNWQEWSRKISSNAFIRAFKPTSFEDVELADVWAIHAEVRAPAKKKPKAGDRTKQKPEFAASSKCYSLQSINFPDVIIHDVSDAQKRITVRCEIRLSSFGNHYLRFYTARGEEDHFVNYGQVAGHDIHRALRRASSLCGKEPISSEGNAYRNFNEDDPDGRYYPDGNLLDIAKKLLECFDDSLQQGVSLDYDRAKPSLEYDLAKTSNVIFSLTEFTGRPLPDDEAQKRESALQRLFMNPIGGPADRLEPWLSRSAGSRAGRNRADPKASRNLANAELGEDAQIYTTANTTFIRLPSHAHFVRLDYEEMAEFVATLEPLYNYWNAQISGRMEKVIHSLKSDDPAFVEDDQITLQQFVVSAQKAMLDIESPSIVTNSVYRSYLDLFIRHSTVGTLKKNFQELTSTTQDVVTTVADYARRQADKKTQHWRYVWGTIIAVFALVISVGQLSEYKLFCVGNTLPPGTCVWRFPEKKPSPADSQNSAPAVNQPPKKEP